MAHSSSPYGSASSPNNGPVIVAQIDDEDFYMGPGPSMPIPQHHPPEYTPDYLATLMQQQSSLNPPSLSQSDSMWSSAHPPSINAPTPIGGDDEVPTINIQRSASPAMGYHELYEPHSPNPGLIPPGTPSEEGGHSPASFNQAMLWPLSVGDYRSIPSPDGHSPTSVMSDGQLFLSPTNTSPHSPFSPPSPFSSEHPILTSPDNLLTPSAALGRMRSASDSHLNMEFAFPTPSLGHPPHAAARMHSDPTSLMGAAAAPSSPIPSSVHPLNGVLLSPVTEDPMTAGGMSMSLTRRHSTTSRQGHPRHRYTFSEPIAQPLQGSVMGGGTAPNDLLTPDYGLLSHHGGGRGRLSHRASSSSSSGGIGAMRHTPGSSRGTSPYSRDPSPSGSDFSFGGYASDQPPPSPSSVVTKPVVTTDPIAEASSKRRTHEARFECEICHKKLTTKTNLDGHRNSHLGVKEFKCQFCDKAFTRDWDRKRHEKTHSKKAAMQCEVCGKSTSRKDALANHRCRVPEGDSNENSNGEEDKGEGPSSTQQ